MQQLLLGEAAPAQVPGQRVPFRRGEPDAEPGRVGQLEAARGQERPPDRGVGAGQPLGVELGGGPVRLDEPAALGLLLAGDMPALLIAQLEAGPAASRSTASAKPR